MWGIFGSYDIGGYGYMCDILEVMICPFTTWVPYIEWWGEVVSLLCSFPKVGVVSVVVLCVGFLQGKILLCMG